MVPIVRLPSWSMTTCFVLLLLKSMFDSLDTEEVFWLIGVPLLRRSLIEPPDCWRQGDGFLGGDCGYAIWHLDGTGVYGLLMILVSYYPETSIESAAYLQLTGAVNGWWSTSYNFLAFTTGTCLKNRYVTNLNCCTSSLIELLFTCLGVVIVEELGRSLEVLRIAEEFVLYCFL